MSPIEASSIFATLVGLICNWRQERAVVAGDKFQDFLTWLTNHNFQELRSLIVDSSELQRELHQLLRLDSAELSKKLDFVAARLSSRILTASMHCRPSLVRSTCEARDLRASAGDLEVF